VSITCCVENGALPICEWGVEIWREKSNDWEPFAETSVV
jgi:hypothetical protein